MPIAGYTQTSGYSTYAVAVSAPESVLRSIPKENIENAIAIRGLKKADSSSASLNVTFKSEDLIIKESGVKEFIDEPKGTDTARKSYYYVEVLYTLRCEAKCYDAQKQLVYSAIYGAGQSKYTSSFMNTRKEAEDYLNANKESLKGNFIAGVINPATVALTNKLSSSVNNRPPAPKGLMAGAN